MIFTWSERSIEDEQRNVHVDGSGYAKISVPGFAEIFESELPEMELEDGNRFKFCTLPGIVLLKLLAWEDRPESRTKDIFDISEILSHFFSINDKEIWEHHSDLFTDEGAGLLQIGARVLGRQIGNISNQTAGLHKRIENLLERNTSDKGVSNIGSLMTRYFNNSVHENVILLNEMKKGLSEAY